MIYITSRIHRIEVSVIHNILKNLSMIGNEINKGYKLCLVRIVDILVTNVIRNIFFASDERYLLTANEVKRLPIVEGLKETYEDRLESYIVRAHISIPSPHLALTYKV